MIYLAAAIDKKNMKIGEKDWFTKMGEALAPDICFNPRGAYLGVDLQDSDGLSSIVHMNMLAIDM